MKLISPTKPPGKPVFFKSDAPPPPCKHLHLRACDARLPPYALDDQFWDQVELGEWRLIGPRLAGAIVFLSLRMRLSRARIREFFVELFDLQLSTGVLDETIREARRAVAPQEDAMVLDIEAAALLHADKTPWKEAGKPLWLWVFVAQYKTLFLIGSRGMEILSNALSSARVPGQSDDRWLPDVPPYKQSSALLGAFIEESARIDRVYRCQGGSGRKGHAGCAVYLDGSHLPCPRNPRPSKWHAGELIRRSDCLLAHA